MSDLKAMDAEQLKAYLREPGAVDGYDRLQLEDELFRRLDEGERAIVERNALAITLRAKCSDAEWEQLSKTFSSASVADRLERAEAALAQLITGEEPNGYPLWFNRAVHQCQECDSEDLCRKHLAMAERDWKDCEKEITTFRTALGAETYDSRWPRSKRDGSVLTLYVIASCLS